MNESEKFLTMFGSIFGGIGVLMLVVGIGIIAGTGGLFGGGMPLLMGIIFASIGFGVMIPQLKSASRRKQISNTGTKYTGKIYGYLEDKGCTMNGDYLINIKVHYFDEYGTEREAVIPTGFTRGSGEYPIGATIDIVGMGTEYAWDKNSVRYEVIDREDELMDDKPINVGALAMTSITCPGCGATFAATKGYVSRCPYCGGTTNA